MDVEKVSRFKYAAWNIRVVGEKEEELDNILNENDIKISVITESKKKLQGTKETEHYTVIYFNTRINQLDALNFIMSLFHASTCFEHTCSSSGGQNCTIQPLVSSHL